MIINHLYASRPLFRTRTRQGLKVPLRSTSPTHRQNSKHRGLCFTSRSSLQWRCKGAHKDALIPPPTKMDHFGFAQGFHNKYTVNEILGCGTFGCVHVATHKETGERFAVKVAVKRRMGNYLQHDFVKRIQHEVDMYNHLGKSLNVVHMYDVFEDDKHVYLVMDLCSGGELWGRIKRGQFNEQNAAGIISEILRTIAQCHSRGVVVRDVKPENFLFQDESASSPLKMIDFGIAEYCAPHQQLHDRAGTALYCAPELLRGKYSFKADVWSAGVIAYELIADRMPFEDDDGEMLISSLRTTRRNLSNKDIFHAILYRPLDFERPPWPSISDSAKDLVQRLLARNPDERPTALEALHHPWLESAAGHASSAGRSEGLSTRSSSSSDEEEAQADRHASNSNASSISYDDSLVQRLQQYGTYNRLKQVALSKLASFIAAYDNPRLAELKEAFSSKDDVGNLTGKVPYQKVERVLKSGEFDLSDIEVRQLLSSFHVDAEGDIDINEWLAALIDWKEVQSSDQWDALISRVFDTFDVDHSGRLGTAELESLLCDEEVGCEVEDTVPAAMRAAEVDSMTSFDYAAEASFDESSEGAQASKQDQASSNGGGTGGAKLSTGEQQQQQQLSASKSPWDRGGIDLPAFAKLLQTAQHDDLELYDSRRVKRE